MKSIIEEINKEKESNCKHKFIPLSPTDEACWICGLTRERENE